MPDERRPSGPGRGPRNRPAGNRPAAPLTGPITVDAATNDALLLFNARLAAQAENEKAERRVQKAARTKDDAAARVRALENDTTATAAERTEAAAAYRAAVEAWERAKRGEADPTPAAAAGAEAEAEVEVEGSDDAVAEDAVADDTADADREPAAEEPAAADEPAAEEPAEG